MNLADELKKLQQLHDSGALSDAEFVKAKEVLLSGSPPLILGAKDEASIRQGWNMPLPPTPPPLDLDIRGRRTTPDSVKCTECGRTFAGKRASNLCPVCAGQLAPYKPWPVSWILVILLIALVGGGGYWWATRQSDKPKANSPGGDAIPNTVIGEAGPPAGHPSAFFPSNPGAKWSYDIQILGPDQPLMYEQVSWPMADDRAVTYATRGILYSRALLEGRQRGGNQHPNSFALEFRVKGPAPKQGSLRYPKGVELEVLRDDLGVFRDSKQAFWAIAESGRFNVNLVVTYDATKSGAPGGPFGGWQRDGSAIRLFFFADKPGTQIGLKGSPDTLLFSGVENTVPQCKGVECFHFVRSVKAAEEKEDKNPAAKAGRLNKGFTEDMWFARGKGLVRLEQRVDGIPSMAWALKSFSADGR